MRTKFTEGVTFTGEALEKVLQKLMPKMRKDIPRLLFLVTDGKPNGEVSTRKMAQKIRSLGVKIFAVGIGNDVSK